MLSLRSIFVAIAVLGVAPLSLAAPSVAGKDALAQHEQRDGHCTINGSSEMEQTLLERRDPHDALEALASRATATTCYITSKKGKDCHSSQCPASEQCTVNDKGNCVFKHKKEDRPFGCDQCVCKKNT